MSIRACWAGTARARQSTTRSRACRARPDSIPCRAVLARGLKGWPKHGTKELKTGRVVPVTRSAHRAGLARSTIHRNHRNSQKFRYNHRFSQKFTQFTYTYGNSQKFTQFTKQPRDNHRSQKFMQTIYTNGALVQCCLIKNLPR
jgi:hypothetical protein